MTKQKLVDKIEELATELYGLIEDKLTEELFSAFAAVSEGEFTQAKVTFHNGGNDSVITITDSLLSDKEGGPLYLTFALSPTTLDFLGKNAETLCMLFDGKTMLLDVPLAPEGA